ncbi:MAG: hypothetical protein HKL96_10165 [Phycisphaerales bacterium]|nr:hypothetical protein [Phycisphaerales bacterium]
MSLMAWLFSIRDVHSSGYLTDWMYLQVPAGVLLIQAYLLDRNLLLPSVVGLSVALFGVFYHLFTYGSRYCAAILVLLAAIPFLFRGTRPKKALVLVLGTIAVVVMMSLAATRAIVGKGEAPNRLAAISVAAQRFIHGGKDNYGAGREFVVGAMEVQVVQQQQNWNYGRVIPDMGIVFLPHQYFPNKYDWVSPWDAPHFFPLLRTYLGLTKKTLSYGVAPTGFADAYVNFWWLFPFLWLFIGYFISFIYDGAVAAGRLDFQGYYACCLMTLFWLVGQDLEAAGYAVLFMLLPTWVAYRYAVVRQIPAVEPAAAVASGRAAANCSHLGRGPGAAANLQRSS